MDEKIIEFKKSLSNLVAKRQSSLNPDELSKDIESLNMYLQQAYGRKEKYMRLGEELKRQKAMFIAESNQRSRDGRNVDELNSGLLENSKSGIRDLNESTSHQSMQAKQAEIIKFLLKQGIQQNSITPEQYEKVLCGQLNPFNIPTFGPIVTAAIA